MLGRRNSFFFFFLGYKLNILLLLETKLLNGLLSSKIKGELPSLIWPAAFSLHEHFCLHFIGLSMSCGCGGQSGWRPMILPWESITSHMVKPHILGPGMYRPFTERTKTFGMENNLPRNVIRSFPSTFQKLFKGRLFSRLKILHLFYSLRHSFKFFPSVSILHFACICWTIKLHDHWSICSPQDPQGPAWYLAPGRHSVNVYWMNKIFCLGCNLISVGSNGIITTLSVDLIHLLI